jgi:hypothetical protein
MSSETIYGNPIQGQLRVAEAKLTAFPVNGASTIMSFVVPAQLGSIRIVDIQWVASAVLNDADGTMLVSVLAKDATEGADDTLVNAQSVEGGTANAPASFTLAAEGAEKEFTLDVGDSIRVTFTNNSAAIDTNGALSVFVFYHPIPMENAGDDIRHASFYR